MFRSRVSDRIVLALLVALALYHVSLLGEGALAWPDEHLSLRSVEAVSALARGDVSGAAAALSAWGSRPAEYAWRMPAAAVQLLLERWTGLSPLSPRSLPIAAFQNVVVAFLLGFAFFRVGSKFLAPEYAALAAGAFSLLTGNQMWVRHLVPYDVALLAHLVALGISLEIPTETPSRAFLRRGIASSAVVGLLVLAYPVIFSRARVLGLALSALILLSLVASAVWLRRSPAGPSFDVGYRAGLVSGLALALYPGYYSFVAALGTFIFFSGGNARLFSPSLATLRNAAVFAWGVATVTFSFEVLARIGGVSYLGSARLLASTLTFGSFEEGFVFLGRWLLAVDHLAALWILPAACLGLLVVLWDAGRGVLSKSSADLGRVCLILGGLYLAYAFQSVVMHKMVFTGRYVRMYVPVVIWLAAAALSRTPTPSGRKIADGIAATLSLLSFAQFAFGYREVGYPADMLFRHGIAYEDLRPENIVDEINTIPKYSLPVGERTSGNGYVTRPGDDRFVILNMGYLALEMAGKPWPKYAPPAEFRLLEDHPHFLVWGPGQFEAYRVDRRLELVAADPRLRIYVRSDAELRPR